MISAGYMPGEGVVADESRPDPHIGLTHIDVTRVRCPYDAASPVKGFGGD
jgi:hypothetical protein